MENHLQMKLWLKGVLYVAVVFVFALWILPNICHAEKPVLGSQNYNISGQIDFSGTTSESENFSVFGFLTDINDVSYWPGEEEVGPSAPVKPAPPTKPDDPLKTITEPLRTLANQGWFQNLLKALTALAGFLALLNLLAPWLSNLPWLNLWNWLFPIGWTKGKRQWGIVYDSESNQPIPGAVVRIFESVDKKLLNSDITDKDGRFGFIVNPGKYYLDVIKQYYDYPSKLVYRDYHREIIEIGEKETTVNVNIPMDPDIAVLGHRLNILSMILDFFSIVRIPVLILGTILTIINIMAKQDLYSILLVLFYVVLWSIEIYNLRKIRTFGVVADIDNKVPVPLAIIRIMDQNTHKLIATRVSGTEGKYFHLVGPGEYTLITTKENFDQYLIKDLRFRRGDVITKDIYLKKKDIL